MREIGLGNEVYVVLEPCAVKVASTVLWGGRASNGLSLPAHPLMHGKAPQAKDFTNERVRRRKDEAVDEVKRAKNRNKSKIRARVEHVFAVVKLRKSVDCSA